MALPQLIVIFFNHTTMKSLQLPLLRIAFALFLAFSITGCPTPPIDDHCFNGMQDEDETDIDCGGSLCDPCPTCTDGIRNGNEEGIDCGGDCPDVCSIVANLEQFITTNSGIPDDYIYDLELVGSTLWLATQEGAATFDGTTWTVYNTANSGLPHNEVRDIHFDIGGNPWFATWGGGVARLNSGTWEVWNSSVSGVPSALDYAENFASTLNWMAVTAPSNGFLIWDGSTWTHYATSNSNMPSDQVSGIAAGASGELYFSTLDAGIVKFSFPTFTTWNSSNSGLPDNEVYSVHFLRNEDLVAGTKGGLAFKSGANWTVYQTANSEIRGNVSNTLWTDFDDRVWLTALGLSLFDGTTWTLYSDDNSHPGLFFANDVVVDGNDRIWVGTQDRGLIAFD